MTSRERRRAPRAPADFPIQLSPRGSSGPAQLKDLSEIGLCCTAQQSLPEMTLVGIDLDLPGQDQRHTIQGAVVRCEPLRSDPGRFEVAVYFTSITAPARAAIASYVAGAAPR